jgi:ankyrin repeat protein
MLLDANPSALFTQDSEGWTPIHLVLLYGGDEDTALLLIRRGGAPAAAVKSPFVGSPLHLACRHGASIAIIEELLKANLSMATTANDNGTKPAEVVWHQFVRNPGNANVVRILRKERNGESDMIESNLSSLDDLVERLTLLVQAAKKEGKSGISRLTHDLLRHQSALGDLTEFLEIAVRLLPEQLEVMDDSQNYLLHVAASKPPPKRTLFPQISQGRVGINYDSIDILVRSFPSAASFTNGNGDLPLHLALSMGKRTWRTGISSLVESYSDALQVRDRDTGLYPFQMAATFPSGKNEAESVETVYELLLSCPHILQC